MYIVPCIIHWYPLIGFFPRTFLGFSVFVVLISCDFHDPPCQERAEASARKKRTPNGKWNRKHPKKFAIEKFTTKLADLRLSSRPPAVKFERCGPPPTA